MSTLKEIEAAVDRLPESEQQQLLQQLNAKLRTPHTPVRRESRKEWMERLRQGAKAASTGRHSITTDQILSELREERI